MRGASFGSAAKAGGSCPDAVVVVRVRSWSRRVEVGELPDPQIKGGIARWPAQKSLIFANAAGLEHVNSHLTASAPFLFPPAHPLRRQTPLLTTDCPAPSDLRVSRRRSHVAQIKAALQRRDGLYGGAGAGGRGHRGGLLRSGRQVRRGDDPGARGPEDAVNARGQGECDGYVV